MTLSGCVLWTSVWAVLMSLPLIVFALAVRGELGWRRNDLVYDRVYLINEVDAAGLAYERTRIVDDERAAGGAVCVGTRVTYWMMRGDADPVDVCQCYAVSGEDAGACP